jgi:cytochrome P450
MTTNDVQIPPGPSAKYNTTQELLSWMDDNCRLYGDIYKASVYGTIVYVISSPEYAERVLRKNWQNYKKGQAIKRIAFLLGSGLMVSEGGLWKHQRRMIQPAFHRNAIGALMGVIGTVNAKLFKRWEQAAEKHERVNVTRDVSLMVLEVVLIAIFGDEYEQVAPHFGILSDVPERNLEFAQKFRFLGTIIVEAVAKRRKENIKSNDILGMLMEARDRESGELMPTHQLINEIMTIIVAGHETTASTLNWTWYLLSQHPEVEEKLARELSDLPENEFPDVNDLPKFTYARQVLDEAMRLYPPGWLMTRRALKDDQLGAYFVPAGTEIYVSPYFIQRHPRLWDAPDRFNPDRFDSDHLQDRHPLAMLPFSAGPRNCVGEFFARVEMQVHLMTIAKRLRLHYAEETPLGLDVGVNLRSKHDFIMTPEIRRKLDS